MRQDCGSRALLYVPPTLILRTLHLAHREYLCISHESQKNKKFIYLTLEHVDPNLVTCTYSWGVVYPLLALC
jgi:hypothetical protein